MSSHFPAKGKHEEYLSVSFHTSRLKQEICFYERGASGFQMIIKLPLKQVQHDNCNAFPLTKSYSFYRVLSNGLFCFAHQKQANSMRLLGTHNMGKKINLSIELTDATLKTARIQIIAL